MCTKASKPSESLDIKFATPMGAKTLHRCSRMMPWPVWGHTWKGRKGRREEEGGGMEGRRAN